jgi:hypothetical protein
VKSPTSLTILVLIGLGSLLTPATVVGLLCAVVASAALYDGASWARRLAYATLVIFATNASVLTLLAVVGIRCSPRVLVATYLLVLLALMRRRGAARSPVFGPGEAWATLASLIVLAVLATPLLSASIGSTMALLSQTTDGATHLQLVSAVMHRHGYVTFAPPRGLSPGLEHYPPGWAGNAWLVSNLLVGHDPSPLLLVRLAGVIAVAGFSLLVFCASCLGLDLARAIRPGLALARQGTVVLVVASMLLFSFGVFFLKLASYGQIWSLVAITLVLLGAGDSALPRRGQLLLCGAAAIALMQTWYLLAPVIAAALLLAVVHVRPTRREAVVAAVLVGPVTAFPVLTGPGLHGRISLSGSELLPTLPGVLGLLAATAAGLLHLQRRRENTAPAVLAFTATVVSALLLLVGLTVAQSGEVVGLSYYGGKILLSLFLLGAIGAAACIASVERETTTFALAIVCAAGVAAGMWSTRRLALPPETGSYRGHLDPRLLDLAFSRHPHGFPEATDAWVLDGCDRIGDLVATKWFYDVSLTWTPERQDALQTYAFATDVRSIADRVSLSSVRHVEIYVGRTCQPEAVASLARLSKVTVERPQ